jgi:Protein of unknown function (DUF3485)
MKRWLYAGAASAALIVTGLVHGFWTERFSSSDDTRKAAERLRAVPARIGEWEGTDIEAGQPVPGVAGSLQRSYYNRRLGATVVIALVNGRPGPVATHTPEACYGASGYRLGERRAVPLDTNGRPAQFWTSVATKSSVTEETRLRLYWAWNGGQGWSASTDARMEFPRFSYPVLHKLYVLRDLSGSGAADPAKADEACEAFLKALLPELDAALFRPVG